MTPSHTIRQEDMTDADRRRAASIAGVSYWTNMGCLVVFLLPLLVLGGWAATTVVADFGTGADPDIGWLLAFVLVAFLFARNSAPFRRDRAALKRAEAAGVTDVVTVTGARWVRVKRKKARAETCFAADIGDGKVLLLTGLWLEGPDTYDASRDAVRAARKSPAPGSGLASRLPRPHAFPCTDFTLRAALRAGHALSIEPSPTSPVPDDVPVAELNDRSHLPPCRLMNGTLEDLDAALDGQATASFAERLSD